MNTVSIVSQAPVRQVTVLEVISSQPFRRKNSEILYFTKIGDLTYGYKILRKDLIQQIQWEGTLHEIYIETNLEIW